MQNRSAALLTSTQRTGLLNGIGESQSDRKLRQRMRTRVKDSLVDLRLLFSCLGDTTLEEVFEYDLSVVKENRAELEKIDIGHQSDQTASDIREMSDLAQLMSERLTELGVVETQPDELSTPASRDRTENRSEDDLIQIQEDLRAIVTELGVVVSRLQDTIEHSVSQLDSCLNSQRQVLLFLQNTETRTYRLCLQEVQSDYREIAEDVDSLLQLEGLIPVDRDLEDRQVDGYSSGSLSQLSDLRTKAATVSERLEVVLRKHSPRYRSRESVEGEQTLETGIEILESYLRTQGLPQKREEDLIRSIGFYLRVADVCDGDVTHILEEAIKSTITTHREDEVLDSVSVTIETTDKELAIQHHERQTGHSRLSDAELRAAVESSDIDTGVLSQSDTRSSQDVLLDQLLEQPDLVGSEIEFVEIEPTIEYHGMPVQANLMGINSEGQTVLIDIEPAPSSQDMVEERQRMRLLTEAVDEEAEVSGIVVVPDTEFTDETHQTGQADGSPSQVDICPIPMK